jgi:hypothetical protein
VQKLCRRSIELWISLLGYVDQAKCEDYVKTKVFLDFSCVVW